MELQDRHIIGTVAPSDKLHYILIAWGSYTLLRLEDSDSSPRIYQFAALHVIGILCSIGDHFLLLLVVGVTDLMIWHLSCVRKDNDKLYIRNYTGHLLEKKISKD